jgi:hypothetical protein
MKILEKSIIDVMILRTLKFRFNELDNIINDPLDVCPREEESHIKPNKEISRNPINTVEKVLFTIPNDEAVDMETLQTYEISVKQ